MQVLSLVLLTRFQIQLNDSVIAPIIRVISEVRQKWEGILLMLHIYSLLVFLTHIPYYLLVPTYMPSGVIIPFVVQ